MIGDGLMSGGRAEFLGDDRRLAVGNEWGEVTVFQTATGESLLAFTVHPGPRGINDVLSLAFVRGSGLLAVAAGYGDAHQLALWNPDTGERVRDLIGHQEWVADLAVSPDGRWLASASADQTVRLWDTQTWDAATVLRGHEDEVYSLAFSADGQRLISGDKDGSVRLWPVPPPARPPAVRFVFEQWGILLLSPDSKRLVTHWPGGGYAMRDLDTGEELALLSGVGSCEGFWQFSPDGQQLLMGGPTGKVKVWDLGRNAFLDEFDTGRAEETHPLLCVPGTDLVLMHHLAGNTNETSFVGRWWSAETRRSYTLWHYAQRRLVAEFPHLGAPLQNCNLSSRGDFAVVHGDGSVSLRRIMPLQAPTIFWPHRRGCTDVAFTPDGDIFATAGSDGMAKLWDATTRREIVALEGYLLSMVRALGISPDGRRLATAGGGKEPVKLWDVQTRQELITLTLGAEGPGLTLIGFSRDGNKLVGQNAQGLHIWRAPSWEEIAAAEAKGMTDNRRP
ncbi:MAG: WD40 repeat domain-containing protein [Verrucomicrobiia bacterium]